MIYTLHSYKVRGYLCTNCGPCQGWVPHCPLALPQGVTHTLRDTVSAHSYLFGQGKCTALAICLS